MRVITTLAALTALTASAAAQTPAPAAPATPEPKVVDFLKPDEVGGRRYAPKGEFVPASVRPDLSSLIVVRGSFKAELLQSAESL